LLFYRFRLYTPVITNGNIASFRLDVNPGHVRSYDSSGSEGVGGRFVSTRRPRQKPRRRPSARHVKTKTSATTAKTAKTGRGRGRGLHRIAVADRSPGQRPAGSSPGAAHLRREFSPADPSAAKSHRRRRRRRRRRASRLWPPGPGPGKTYVKSARPSVFPFCHSAATTDSQRALVRYELPKF